MAGTVVWHDLNTRDTAKAASFYGDLFGWEVRARAGQPHAFLYADEEAFGCVVKQDAGDKSPAHWLAYVQVDDLDATVERARRAGGKALVPRMAITDKDAFAVLLDPLGAAFAAYFTSNPLPPGYPKQGPGHFCWEELITTDPARAVAFYGEVFGWTHETVLMPTAPYRILRSGAVAVGGAAQMPPGLSVHPHWLSYVAVADVDATAAKAGELGARQHVPPTDIPGIGRFSIHGDPSGAAFALYGTAKEG